MKKFKKLLSVLSLGVLLVTNGIPVSAAEKEEPVLADSLSDFDLGEYSQYIFEPEESDIQLYAPAPPLTQFSLYLINSEKAGQEEITPGQVGSRLDHGGTWFQAITIEIGYAKTRFAYFKNMNMTLTDKATIDLDNDSIVDGYICLWTYEGPEYETGIFSANSTSANSPWNTMSLSFSVN